MPNRPGRPAKNLGDNAPNRLRELREDAQMTQEQVADALGWDKRTISRLETGERQLRVADLPRLAAVLGARPSDVLQDAPDPRERQLVRQFRRLSADDQDRLLRMAAALDATYQPAPPPPANT